MLVNKIPEDLMKYRCFMLCAVIMNVTPVLSQSQQEWQLTLSDGKVFSKIRLTGLKDTLLIFADSAGECSVTVDSIVEIRMVRERGFWKGVKKGALVGSAVGIVGGALFSKPGGHLVGMDRPKIYRPLSAIALGIGLGIGGGLIGGTISALGGSDDIFDLSYMPHAGRQTAVGALLAREKK
jgi:hypothetical protein